MTNIEVLDENQVPLVVMSVGAMAKVQQYVHQCSLEIGWMGLVTRQMSPSGFPMLMLHDPYAPAQEVSGATTDLDPTGKGSFADWAISLGEKAELIKWWGHSHVNMGVSPSGTDMTTFYEHIENDKENPFVMSIHNKKGASYVNLYLGHGLYVKDAPMVINYGSQAIIDEVAAELSQNVREKTYVKPVATNFGYTGNPIGYGQSQHTGGGSDRLTADKSDRKKWNAKGNALGLRRSGKPQHPKPSVRSKRRGKKQGASNAGNSAA